MIVCICGSLQKLGALTTIRNSRALIVRTPSKQTPIISDTPVLLSGKRGFPVVSKQLRRLSETTAGSLRKAVQGLYKAQRCH